MPVKGEQQKRQQQQQKQQHQQAKGSIVAPTIVAPPTNRERRIDIGEITDISFRESILSLCARKRQLTAEKAKIEKEEGQIGKVLKEIFDRMPGVVSVVGQATYVTSTRHSLSQERLLAEGVSMAVIKKATVESESSYVKVTPLKKTEAEKGAER